MSAEESRLLIKHDRAVFGSADALVGVDEAGRGALAGPVVAAALRLSRASLFAETVFLDFEGVDDSKACSATHRDAMFSNLLRLSQSPASGLSFAVGVSSVDEIERLNILGATRLAMQRALEALGLANTGLPLFSHDEPAAVKIIVDGRPLKPFPFEHEAIVKGDAKSLVIAAASIVAKVTRDRLMRELDATFPGYGFSEHKGYGTASHRAAIVGRGPCAEHRKLFLRRVLAVS